MEKIIIYPEHAGYSEVFKPYGALDDIPDLGDDDVPSAVDKLWQAGPVNAALAKSSGVSISTDWLQVPETDLDDDTGPLDNGLHVVKTAPASSSTLGKRARPVIAKTATRVDEDGFKWRETFDAGGKLLDCKVLLDIAD
jgi:hypothetical protein